MQRINFTETILNNLKLTAQCSFANAVYKLTMKAQQGLKCDDLYKKSVIMNDLYKLLCKYKLDQCIITKPEVVAIPTIWERGIANFGGKTLTYYLVIDDVDTYLGEGTSVETLVTSINANTNTTGVSAEQNEETPAYFTITSPDGYYSRSAITSIVTPSGSIAQNIVSYHPGKDAIEEVCVDYTEEELNCITPQDLQYIYEFTHKYKETLAKSTKKIATPNRESTNDSRSDCCTWGTISGNIGNQSDLVNYLASIEKNFISIEDDSTEVEDDLKTLNFKGTGVTVTPQSNGQVDIEISQGSGGSTNLDITPSATDNVISNDNGDGFTIELADDTNAGLMSPEQFSKLDNLPDTITADNGLTLTSDNIQLGGLLTKDTTINEVDNDFILQSLGKEALYLLSEYVSTNDIQPSLISWRTSTGTATNGIGNCFDMYVKRGTGVAPIGGPNPDVRIVALSENSTPASGRKSNYEVWVNKNNTLVRYFKIDADGQITLDSYGSGNFTGTVAYLLGVDSSGNVIETSASGGGATDLGYTASPTNGIVTSSTGTDATLTLATGTNAGLLAPADFTKLGNQSGTNTGDNATNSTSNTYADGKVADAITNGVTTIAPSQNAVFDALALLKIEEINLQDIGTALPASTYTFVLEAKYARTINELTVDAGAGTCTLTMNINGTPVTGVNAVSVSTTKTTYTATAANSIAIGDLVTIVTSSNSGLENLQITVKTTRT